MTFHFTRNWKYVQLHFSSTSCFNTFFLKRPVLYNQISVLNIEIYKNNEHLRKGGLIRLFWCTTWFPADCIIQCVQPSSLHHFSFKILSSTDISDLQKISCNLSNRDLIYQKMDTVFFHVSSFLDLPKYITIVNTFRAYYVKQVDGAARCKVIKFS